MLIYPVVLAGGSGTRLWPLSRSAEPKQFLSIGGERSLLQQALLRLQNIPRSASPVIVCNEEHRYLVAEHCRQVGVTPSATVLEPAGRSTAPALTLGALCAAHLARRDVSAVGDPDPVLLVSPADHLLRGPQAFADAVDAGVSFASAGGMAAVGVVPTSANTGYGYVEMGESVSGAAHRVASFVEKPEEQVARKLVESGRFLWNSGIFMTRASVWLDQIRLHRPDIADACTSAFERGRQDGEFFRPDPGAFARCPGDFIAYAILEKIAGRTGDRATVSESPPFDGPECVVVPMRAGWSDVGSWASMWEEERRDAAGNAIWGDVVAESTTNSLLIGRDRLVAAIGLDNVVVVDTEDCVLVADMARSEELRAVVERLKTQARPEV